MLKAIRQLFQKKPNPEALRDYLAWREVIFSVTSGQAEMAADRPNQVYGVVMDVGLSDDFTITITAFPTGESSLRTTVGGGAIGLGGDQLIAEQAKHIVNLAQSLVEAAKPMDSHGLPKSQKVFFYFLTTSGLRLSITTLSEIESQNHRFYEVFKRFTVIKARSEELTGVSRNK